MRPELPEYLRRIKYPERILRPTRRAGDFDAQQVECPCVFVVGAGFCMAYTGFDGERLSLGLAHSTDLVAWERQGQILGPGAEGCFDAGGVSGPFVFREGGSWHLFYCGFPGEGYESGAGAMGHAVSDDLLRWERVSPNPVLAPGPPGAWDSGGIYKPFLLRHAGLNYLFYNAKDSTDWPWHERIGLATSPDLEAWRRRPGGPLVDNGPAGAWDSRFVSDPWVVEIGGRWHLFYYGFDGEHAREGVALSEDLAQWEKSPWNPILDVGEAGSIDSRHAHKPCVIEHGGTWYHFYVAVDETERCVALATSRPI